MQGKATAKAVCRKEADIAMSIPETTVGYTAGQAGKERRTRCFVGGNLAEGSRFARELGHLLHRRLRVVALIALVPLVLFLIRNMIEEHRQDLVGPIGLVLQALVTGLLGWLATLLWTQRRLSLCSLRKMEIVLFGSLGVYFAWLQVCTFRHRLLFE